MNKFELPKWADKIYASETGHQLDNAYRERRRAIMEGLARSLHKGAKLPIDHHEVWIEYKERGQSSLRPVTEEDLREAMVDFLINDRCAHTIIHESSGFAYDIRRCAICGETLGAA